MEQLYNLLRQTGLKVFYAVADKNAQVPYIVYTDYNEKYIKADNHISDTIINVQVDFYTNTPFDSKKADILNLLDKQEILVTYKLMYDSDEKVYHHIFDCEVLG